MLEIIQKLIRLRKHHARPKRHIAKEGHCWRGIPYVPSKKSLGTFDADGFVYEGVVANAKRRTHAQTKFYNAKKSNL